MGQVIPLFEAEHPGLSLDDMLRAIRHLDLRVLDVMLASAHRPNADLAAALDACGGVDCLLRILTVQGGNVGRWRQFRHAWRRLADLLDAGCEDREILVEQDHHHFRHVLHTVRRGRWKGSALFPATPSEAERITTLVRRYRDDAEERARKTHDAARLQQQAASIRQREAVDAIVAEVVNARGVARHRLVLSLRKGGREFSQIAIGRIDRGLIDVAVAWDMKRKEAAKVSKARAVARKAEELESFGRDGTLPDSRYLVFSRLDDGGFEARFETPLLISLGSATRAKDAAYRAGAGFKGPLAVDKRVEDAKLTIRFGVTALKSLHALAAKADQALDGFAAENLSPVMVEEALGITSTERLRWLKDGRLPSAGKGSFYKWKRAIEFDLHAPALISSLRDDPGVLEGWRAADALASGARRRAGAKQAIVTRKVNETTRTEARREVDDLARDIAVSVGSPLAVPLVRLAVMTTMCSRWAKRCQERDDRPGKAEMYGLKDRALRILVPQPWTEVRFLRSGQPRIRIEFCGDHRDDFRDARRWSQCSAHEWAFENRSMLRLCGECTYGEEADHYSLYDVSLRMGDACFSWHVPFPLGKDWLPEPVSLPKADHSRLDAEDGFFRFGRSVDEDEMVAWPIKRLKTEIEAVMKLFEADSR